MNVEVLTGILQSIFLLLCTSNSQITYTECNKNVCQNRGNITHIYSLFGD